MGKTVPIEFLLSGYWLNIQSGSPSELEKPFHSTRIGILMNRPRPKTTRMAFALAFLAPFSVHSFNHSYPLLTTALWLISIAFFLYLLKRSLNQNDSSKDQNIEFPKARNPSPRLFIFKSKNLPILILLLTGAGLRFLGVAELPHHFDGDEGRQGLYALTGLFSTLESGAKSIHLFEGGWNWLPNGTFVLQSVIMWLLGNGIESFRHASALWGSVGLITFYLLARELVDNKAAVYGLCILVFSRNHIEWSRIGTSNIQTAMFTTTALWVGFRGIKQQNGLWIAVSGVVCGIGLNSYHANKATALILLTFFLCTALSTPQSGLKKNIWNFLQGLWISAGPLLLWMISHPVDSFMSTNDRTIQDDLFNLLVAANYYEVIFRLSDQLYFTLKGIFISPGSFPYGYAGALVDWISAVPVIFGCWVIWFKSPKHLRNLMGAWLGVTLFFGSVLTINPPHHPRLTGIFPALSLCGGLGLVFIEGYILRFRKIGSTRLALPVIALILLSIALLNLKNYFLDFPAQRERNRPDYIVDYLIHAIPNTTLAIIGKDQSVDCGSPVLAFEALAKNILCTDYPNLDVAIATNLKKTANAIIFLTGGEQKNLTRLQALLPTGRIVMQRKFELNTTGEPMIAFALLP